MPDWKQYEGELAGGEFPLERLIDGREGSAVFITRIRSARAVIKLVLEGHAQARELVERWNRAATLCHPHLVRIFAAGTWALADTPLAYLVMEYAEENLAEVLRERPLTTDETRDMLQPVAEALEYLHGQGLVHGNVQPSDIFAVEDTVKISSETVSAGDPAADIRALGVTLVQALTPVGQEPAADALPSPFREIAENCLNQDPQLRWSAGNIRDRLRSPVRPASAPAPSATPVAEPAARKSRLRYYGAAAVLVVGAVITGSLVMDRTPAAPVPSAPEPLQPAPAAVPPAPAPTGRTAAPKTARPAPPPAQDGITRRVLPDIPAPARNTVHGIATVAVRVAVGPSGNVTEATLEAGGSPYFGRLAREAARQWQFAPAEGAGPRNWILRFEITPTATEVIPLRADRE
jgi:TonB family protein